MRPMENALEKERRLRSPTIFGCILACLVCFTGCSVQKQWTAMGGSRADGTVDLSYEYGGLQQPQIDEAQGVDLAATTCGGWGYSSSQPFGGTLSRCEEVNGYGMCLRYLVTRKYQCLGAPGSSPTPRTEPVALSPGPTGPPANLQPAAAAVPAANPPAGDQWNRVGDQ
jgi:YecR-like lipoprotein